MNDLSMKLRNKKMEIDIDKLASVAGRDEFETKVRDIGIDHLNVSKHLVNLESDTILKRMLLQEKKRLIRLYMIEGFNLSSRDNGSASDTYLQIHCNGTTYSERDNYQLDEPNPVFYKLYEFQGLFPGSSPVKI